MEQVITVRRRAPEVVGLRKRTLGRIALTNVPAAARADSVLVLHRGHEIPHVDSLQGYAAILAERDVAIAADTLDTALLSGYDSLENLTDGTIVALEPTGGTNTLFRPESHHNAIFATGTCNSNCLMCSQPPVEWDPPNVVAENLRLIDLIETAPGNLGISGGEPTLLGAGLVEILEALKRKFPQTPVFMLSNGRGLADPTYAQAIAASVPKQFVCGIPLHADVPAVHDYIAQAKGAFEETLAGLYNCARYSIPVEVRVVLHKQSIPRLHSLMEFIYRNTPFVEHVALMGLENMGYVKRNWDELWIDPVDYQEDLEKAVRYLHYRGMNVSIYNHPRCITPKALWGFARQSISDFKNLFLPECRGCSEYSQCSGLFASSETRHSRGIRAI